MSRPMLGTLELMQTAFSGFGYPARAQVIPLLGAAADTGGNAVLQTSALTFRQATVSWVAPDPGEVDTARGYFHDLSSQAYVDHDGNAFAVRVIAFEASVRIGNYWDCTATLLEEA